MMITRVIWHMIIAVVGLWKNFVITANIASDPIMVYKTSTENYRNHILLIY